VQYRRSTLARFPRAIVNSDVGRLSMEAISADLAVIADSANTRLNARLEPPAAGR
jgi:hypothetical protein